MDKAQKKFNIENARKQKFDDLTPAEKAAKNASKEMSKLSRLNTNQKAHQERLHTSATILQGLTHQK